MCGQSKHSCERPFTCHCAKQFSRLDTRRQYAQTRRFKVVWSRVWADSRMRISTPAELYLDSRLTFCSRLLVLEPCDFPGFADSFRHSLFPSFFFPPSLS
ncbi:hypothetical protein C8F04DRAFT_1116228, partial [Mycena alexandri]